MTWIRTHTGKIFDFRALDQGRPVEVDIHDIAHALARQTRFGGHVHMNCSVAEHSVRVLRIVNGHLRPDKWSEDSDTFKSCLRAALLHDATEAYLVDLPGPLKAFLSDYRALEAKLEGQIFERFGCYPENPYALEEQQRVIKQADRVALAVEMRDCMGRLEDGFEAPNNLIAFDWDAATARTEFLAEAAHLGLL